jgi:hypothetical protein
MPDLNSPKAQAEIARMKARQRAEVAAWKGGPEPPKKSNAVKKTRKHPSVGRPKRANILKTVFGSKSNGKSFKGRH